MNILLRSAKIIEKGSEHHGKKRDILIEKGIITKIGNSIELPNRCKEVSLPNLHVSAGWFDTSASLGEPGFEERENIEHGLEVAGKSGITAILLQPNTNPHLDSKSSVEFVIGKSKGSAVSLYPIANLTQKAEGKELAELFDMSNSGARAFGDYNSPIHNVNLLKIAFQYVQNFDGIVVSYPENKELSAMGSVNESENTTRLGLNSVPTLSEELQIRRDLSMLEYTGGKLHIPTISCARSVQLIREAKRKGLDVTCSVSAHHISLTDKVLDSFDTNFKVLPPLRSSSDVKALIKGVNDGTIDMICSDHNPIDIERKNVEFEQGDYGTIGFESLFGALNNQLELEIIIEQLTRGSRERFGVTYHPIKEGQIAELSLFDPETAYEFSKEEILSKSKNSAFDGQTLKGRAYGIYANNELVLR